MAMKINLTPREYEVEDPKYGRFTIIPIGINKDLEMQQMSREIGDDLKELESYVRSDKDKKLSDKEIAEAQVRVNELAQRIEDRKARVIEIWKSVFIFKDEKKKEQLFEDVTIDRIRAVYDEVLANA